MAVGAPLSVFSHIGTFVRRHLIHLLLLVPGALVVTATHEAAHATAVVLQGGTLREFHCVPSSKGWGYVTYQFPARTAYSRAAVSLAPYALWLVVAAFTTVVTMRWPPRSGFVASCWFVWGFLIPLADIANASFPWLLGATNDLSDAFGPPTPEALFVVAAMTALCVAWGWPVQRRAYGAQRLPLPAYLLLSLATLGVLFACAVGLRLLA